jgi:hypothetical protein
LAQTHREWSNLAVGFALRLWLTLSQQRPARPADQPHADRQGPGGGQLFGNVDPALTGSAFNHEGSIVFWTFQPSSACSFIQTWHHMLALIEKKP